MFKKIAPYKFWKHFQGVLFFCWSFQPFSEDIFHGSFNSLRRRQEFRKVQNLALESRWTDLFQILWNISDLQEILMLKMFCCRKKGLLLKCSQWGTIWFDLCVFAGQNILMTCALRLRSSIQKTTTQLSEIGCVKSWWIEKTTGRCSGWIWLQLGMLQRFIYEIKNLPNPLKLVMFLFLKSGWRWGMPRFSRAQKNKTLPSFGSRNLLRLKEAATTETIYFFPIEHTDYWWICSNSEIPLWTFPIEPFSPPRQTCFDFTRAPWDGGINMFHMLRWICSKLKVAQLPQQVV